jgi:hypothetical protein
VPLKNRKKSRIGQNFTGALMPGVISLKGTDKSGQKISPINFRSVAIYEKSCPPLSNKKISKNFYSKFFESKMIRNFSIGNPSDEFFVKILAYRNFER